MRWTAVSLAIALMCVTVNQAVAQKKVALVIGNDVYVHGTALDNPGRDARAIGATLKKLGFKLVEDRPLVDLDKATTDRMVEAFGIMAQDADIALFYFSGHGMQIGGTNYLVPIDLGSNLGPFTPTTVDFQTLNADLVLRVLDKSGSRVKMMLLDACRTNPFLASKDQGGGLAQMKAPAATVIGFATQPNTTASQGPAGGLSPYAKALATYMAVKGLGLFVMLNEVGLAVMDATNNMQQPWIAYSPIPRDFVLNAPEAVPPIPTTPPLLGRAPPDTPVPSPDTGGASLDLIQRAYKQLDSNDYVGARATLTQAIKVDGTFAPAYSYRGFAWYREGLTAKDPRNALAAYREGFPDFDIAIHLTKATRPCAATEAIPLWRRIKLCELSANRLMTSSIVLSTISRMPWSSIRLRRPTLMRWARPTWSNGINETPRFIYRFR